VEAEGDITLGSSLPKQWKWREGGGSGRPHSKKKGRGSGKDRLLRWCLGGRQLTEATEASDGRRAGAHSGDPVGERRGGRAGWPEKERNMGPAQKNIIRFDLFKNFSNGFELI
jgi:hypothetical protein